MPVKELINQDIHQLYWENGFNCARVTLVILSKLFHQDLDGQVLQSAIGMHGAGRYRAQCGLVEGILLFVGVYMSARGKSDAEIISACYSMAEGFEKEFTSLSCRDLRPGGFREDDPPHACEELTQKTIAYGYEFIKGLSL